MKIPVLQSFRLKNFKAVQDSGTVRLTPLTVFIGNNGSGKSSLVEGLETLQAIIEHGLDRAMQQWHGFEHIWNQAVPRKLLKPREGRPYHSNSMSFELRGKTQQNPLTPTQGPFAATMKINAGPGGNELFIQEEKIILKGRIRIERDDTGQVRVQGTEHPAVSDGESILRLWLRGFTQEWQFVSLVPQAMGSPTPQKRTSGPARLAKDGSNIADYLLHIRRTDQSAFDGIVETLQYVLPFARDLQPALTSELERTVYLQLAEGNFKVPGWLLSTGTLRILTLLALLRHPTPPPLIVIEEIENGLDPRTIHLIVDEFRNAVESGRTQVMLTTHSPYLLDLLDLSHIVLVERVNGQPTFTRPADQKSLQEWAKTFGPGRLYTMDRLGREKRS
ncbi:MAG: chromosome segregation protein SMC [Candidatus Handelsmanbacteria bacterium RIFCSPLOWO2_12_FULL_64_10]|uniref:Chromosome segregation protein SMC n=1 Tax=Handelsmanbacteria sp. (strain RIFCSPLOWO2_12_FULL_64_10) TaxID=1817868 RepID=A0A1F6D4G7_HANXR|nr:MAG: chromosome segregation protein SMC [Candidatus Handelsmanbacteria bacterium RIFCSPLOWO2_12_FULL_64_10]